MVVLLAPAAALAHNRCERSRVPRVPPGTYPVVMYDGSEGGTHYVWELIRVRR
jgi:hypothetical protein